MRYKHLHNVLNGLDLNLLESKDFKEDSVREEIILPIIKALGYSASKPFQIVRSKKLLHPFVSIGSQKKKIHIIPDYLFEVNEKPIWILDAKAPTESIIKSKHVEQAYSYAIHSEVRAKYFALCNGLEFALYSIDEIKPILQFPIEVIPMYWETLIKYLAPHNILNSKPCKLNKDLGLHLKRLGFDTFESLIFMDVPISHIAQMDPDFFSSNGTVIVNDETFAVTFDFGYEAFEQLKGKIPAQVIQILRNRQSGSRQNVNFGDRVFFVNIDCRIGDKLEETTREIFLPLWINSIF